MSSVTFEGANAPDLLHDLLQGEPTIDEILADPIVGLILRRDRLTAGAVRETLAPARRRFAPRSSAPALSRAA